MYFLLYIVSILLSINIYSLPLSLSTIIFLKRKFNIKRGGGRRERVEQPQPYPPQMEA